MSDYTCLECDGTDFQNRECPFEMDGIRGKYIIITAAYVCLNCGWQLMTTEQMDLFREKVKRHEL